MLLIPLHSGRCLCLWVFIERWHSSSPRWLQMFYSGAPLLFNSIQFNMLFFVSFYRLFSSSFFLNYYHYWLFWLVHLFFLSLSFSFCILFIHILYNWSCSNWHLPSTSFSVNTILTIDVKLTGDENGNYRCLLYLCVGHNHAGFFYIATLALGREESLVSRVG